MAKPIPDFKSEDEERQFWQEHDSTAYLDWDQAEHAVFPNLKPSTKTIMGRNIIILSEYDESGTGATEITDSIKPLGSVQHVIDKIKEAFPEIHTSDPLWIILTREDYSLTFNFYGKDMVEALSIGIHGTEDAIDEVKHLCRLTGWRAIDPNTGVIN